MLYLSILLVCLSLIIFVLLYQRQAAIRQALEPKDEQLKRLDLRYRRTARSPPCCFADIGGRSSSLGNVSGEDAAGADDWCVGVLSDHIEALRVDLRLRRPGAPEDVVEIVAIA